MACKGGEEGEEKNVQLGQKGTNVWEGLIAR